jgi:tetratricopeptide (TPR) repeat protein
LLSDALRGKSSYGHRELESGIVAWNEQGQLDQAVAHFDLAMTWALEQGDSDLWDRAFCNRCAAEMELGRAPEWLPELRQIVLRSSDPENSFLAAYNVAHAYELEKDFTKALFYARIAHDRCAKLRRRDWLAWSKNQTANLLLGQSHFEEACTNYEHALELMPEPPSVQRALILDNLGYCRIVQGRHDEGFTLLFPALRTVRRFGAERYEARVRLSLCWGYLELGRLRRALAHGLRAFELADRHNDVESIKNAHYLLGEAYNELGCHATARDYFTRLQKRFYPDAVHVPELLMAVDVRNLINLKA